MNVLVVTPNLPMTRWHEPLKAALADHRVIDSRNPHDPENIDVAVVGWMGGFSLRPYPKLLLVQSTWMGVDRLIENPLIDPSVPIARMVDPSMPASMAETVVAHALAAHRQLDVYARQSLEQQWKEREQQLASQTTVAVLGLGELGRAAANMLRAVGFRVVGWSRTAQAVDGIIVSASLETTLEEADIVVNLLPLTEATRWILCAQTFALLPAGAVLVNVGRGGHIVDDDLIAALESRHIRHAVLDVFHSEPLPKGHPFWTSPYVTVTPHIAAESFPETCVPVISENIRRLGTGEVLRHLVDRELGY
jgi:glyoxylate/hydroxypyruvate reductase